MTVKTWTDTYSRTASQGSDLGVQVRCVRELFDDDGTQMME